MSDREHLRRFAGGVEAWNAWRGANPGVRPDLSGSRIRMRRLSGVDLRGADLRRVMIPGVDLSGADLRDADLAGADLMESNLRGARLGGADLRGANLMGADLEGADLEGADLEDAVLYGTGLEGTEGVRHSLWLGALLEFAEGLRDVEGEGRGFEFEDAGGAAAGTGRPGAGADRIEIELCDPIPAGAAAGILGALSRLYGAVTDRDLLAPVVMIGGGGGADGAENRISFEGSTRILVDFAERFLELHEVRIQPADEVRERFGCPLARIAREREIELRHLENVADYLYEHGIPEGEIAALCEGRGPGIASLARDAAALEEFLRGGSIIDVRALPATPAGGARRPAPGR